MFVYLTLESMEKVKVGKNVFEFELTKVIRDNESVKGIL